MPLLDTVMPEPASSVQSSSKSNKRSRSQDNTDRDSKKTRLDHAANSDKKDKKKKTRRRKRKISVVGDGVISKPFTSQERVQEEPDDLDANEVPSPDPSRSTLTKQDGVEDTSFTTQPPEFIEGSSISSAESKSLLPLFSEPTTVLKHASVGPNPNPQLEDDVAGLTQSLSKANETVRAHETLLASLLPSLTCQICLDLLHKPYVLAPCGHVACHGCLVSWFTTPPAQGFPHGNAMFHPKTCPHCRAPVSERPAEAWSVKDMVAALVRSGLATGFPPPPDPASVDPQDAGTWTGIFPPPRRDDAGVDEPWEDFGMFDDADGCYRCVECMHEIVDGECVDCGRMYPGHYEHGDGILPSFAFPEDVDPDERERLQAEMLEYLHHALPQHIRVDVDSVSEGEGDSSDGSDDGYGGSFIDDGEGGAEIIEISSDDEGRGEMRGRRRGPPIVLSDDEDEIHRNGPRGRRGAIRVIQSDDDDELASARSRSPDQEVEDDGAIAGPPRRLAHLLNPVDDDLDSQTDRSASSREGSYVRDDAAPSGWFVAPAYEDEWDNGDGSQSGSDGKW